MSSLLLRVTHAETNVVDTLGPGARAVVWVQGCSLRCPGCMVPETWSAETGGLLYSPANLAAQLLRQMPDMDGITVSGGEPTEQPFAVAELLQAFHDAGKNTFVYSGYRLEELIERNDPATDLLLSRADVLVDGRFDMGKAGGLLWRGSSNQRVLFLSERISPPTPEQQAGTNRIEVRLSGDGGLILLGIPRPGTLAHLRKRLNEGGLQFINEQPWK